MAARKPVELTPELIAKARADKKIREPKQKSERIPATELGAALGLTKAQSKDFEVDVRIDGTVNEATDIHPLADKVGDAIAVAVMHCYCVHTGGLLFNQIDADDLLRPVEMLPFLVRVSTKKLELEGVDISSILSDDAKETLDALDGAKKK